MVDLAEIQAAYYMVAATGVLVAAGYYILNMRNAEKARRREIIFRKLPVQDSYYYDALYTVAKMTDFKTREEFVNKYSYWANHDAFCKLMYILSNYNLVGLLLKEKLASAEEIFQIYPPNMFVVIYERFKFLVERNRLNYSGEVSNPEFFKSLEMLYVEAKRRYPKLDSLDSHDEAIKMAKLLDRKQSTSTE